MDKDLIDDIYGFIPEKVLIGSCLAIKPKNFMDHLRLRDRNAAIEQTRILSWELIVIDYEIKQLDLNSSKTAEKLKKIEISLLIEIEKTKMLDYALRKLKAALQIV